MTTDESADSETETVKQPRSAGRSLVWVVVAAISVVGGFATPLLVASLTASKHEVTKQEQPKTNPSKEMVYVDFEEVVGVLARTKFRRYLRIVVSLEVAKSEKAEVEARIATRTAVLRNRILMHIADITQEDLAGTHGHNQLRRKFHQMFNQILFDDGVERIQDVLFKELMVQ